MKKVIRLVAVFMVLILAAIGFAGCGSSQTASSSKMFSNLQAYLEYPNTQKSLENAMSSLPSTLEFDCYAEGDTLVYEYKYTSLIPESALELTKKAIEDSASSLKSAQKIVFTEILEYVDVENPIVCYRYLNSDGALIAEIKFDKSVLDE